MAGIGTVGYVAWAGLGVVGVLLAYRTLRDFRRFLRGPAYLDSDVPVPVTSHRRALYSAQRPGLIGRALGLLGGAAIWAAAPFDPPTLVIVAALSVAGVALLLILISQLMLLRLPRP